MDRKTRQRVRERAGNCCEYCGLPQEAAPLARLHVEHIRAKQHRGRDVLGNLALSCNRCNFFKGPNLAGYDPETDSLVPLFNPRRQKWKRHFSWNGPVLVGKTRIGRATIAVLNINDPERVEFRKQLMDEGLLPKA